MSHDVGTSPPRTGALGGDRVTRIAAVVLIVLAAVAWADVIRTSLVMNDDMGMPGMGMDDTSHDASDPRGFLMGWAVMMTAMMLPSALPMIALFSATQPRSHPAAQRAGVVAAFTAVYLVVWAASGIPVHGAMRWLESVAEERVGVLVAVVLIVAGAYQFSPLKHACLRACRSPLGFFVGHWRPGFAGSLGMAVAHAGYCLGCCWALMVVLVAAGAMGLAWVVLIAALVGAEKLAPHGQWIARLAGAALIGLGLATAFRPELVAALRGSHPM